MVAQGRERKSVAAIQDFCCGRRQIEGKFEKLQWKLRQKVNWFSCFLLLWSEGQESLKLNIFSKNSSLNVWASKDASSFSILLSLSFQKCSKSLRIRTSMEIGEKDWLSEIKRQDGQVLCKCYFQSEHIQKVKVSFSDYKAFIGLVVMGDEDGVARGQRLEDRGQGPQHSWGQDRVQFHQLQVTSPSRTSQFY